MMATAECKHQVTNARSFFYFYFFHFRQTAHGSTPKIFDANPSTFESHNIIYHSPLRHPCAFFKKPRNETEMLANLTSCVTKQYGPKVWYLAAGEIKQSALCQYKISALCIYIYIFFLAIKEKSK